MLFETVIQNDAGIFLFLLIVFLIVLFFALSIFLFVFWILMIIDCVKRRGLSDGERVAWILVLVFLGFIGASIYYFAVKRK